jgi:hypothetical protein
MARLREPQPAPDAPPERFCYADWADEKADGPPPAYWDGEAWMYYKIRAFKRYLAAKHGLRDVDGPP